MEYSEKNGGLVIHGFTVSSLIDVCEITPPVDSVNMHTCQGLKGYCGRYSEGVLFKPTGWLFK